MLTSARQLDSMLLGLCGEDTHGKLKPCNSHGHAFTTNVYKRNHLCISLWVSLQLVCFIHRLHGAFDCPCVVRYYSSWTQVLAICVLLCTCVFRPDGFASFGPWSAAWGMGAKGLGICVFVLCRQLGFLDLSWCYHHICSVCRWASSIYALCRGVSPGKTLAKSPQDKIHY